MRGLRKSGLDRLLAEQVRAQVLLIVVGQDRDHDRIRPELVLDHQGAQDVRPGRDADGHPDLGGQLLGHDDGIAVVDRDDRVELGQVDDGRDELVADALDAVLADLVPRGHGRRVGGLERMELDGGILLPQEAARAHDRPARPDPGDEGVGTQSLPAELPPDLGPGRPKMGVDVVFVGELPRQERAFERGGVLLGEADAAQEAAFLLGHEADRGPEAADEVLALLAHPVGHEDGHGMTEGPAEGREGDARVAARRLDDHRARLERPSLVAASEDVIGHPVLDAAGHVEVLGLGIEDAPLPVEAEIDGQEGGVAGPVAQTVQTRFEDFFVGHGPAIIIERFRHRQRRAGGQEAAGLRVGPVWLE